MSEQKAAPIDPQVLLRTKDFLVSRTQKTLNAPPFLALAIELSHLPDTRIALGQYVPRCLKIMAKEPKKFGP
jgi:hypothetical protein